MDKILELLRLFEKFGVKPGKIIGAGDRKVTPIKKPILSKPLNRGYILEEVEGGNLGINTVKNEIEDIAPLVFQKQLNDVEINNAINNLNYLDSLLNPTNIIDITTKQPVKGLESIRPTSIAGGLEKAGKQLEGVGKKLEETTQPKSIIGDMLEDYARAQKAMQLSERTGYVRATVREIMRQDILSKKLKLPVEMENEILQGLGEPIDIFRKVYGEDALEQMDSVASSLGQFKTEVDAARFARKAFDFQPKTITLPETTTIKEAKKAEQEYGLNKQTAEVVDIPERSFMNKIKDLFTKRKEPAEVTDITAKINRGRSVDDLIDEYNRNIERMGLLDEEGGSLISYTEFQELSKKNDEIEKILESLNVKSAKQIDEVKEKPEGIIIPFKKKPPEEFAEGGITRTKFASGGKGKKILDIIKNANKRLKGKKSMETVNPKTGEVTVPDEFITTAESKSRKLTKDEIADYEEKIGRDSEDWMLEGTVNEAEEALKRSKAEEAYYRGQYLTGKLDPVPGEQTEARMKFLQKKLEEASEVKDRRLITPKEIEELKELESRFIYKKGDPITEENFASTPFFSQETLDNLEKAREMTKGMSLEEEMNMILNQYDKSMFIKNEQGIVDVTNPQNIQKMALLLKRDFPELYRRLEMEIGSQNNILENFDITGRKPNASGGLNYLMGF